MGYGDRSHLTEDVAGLPSRRNGFDEPTVMHCIQGDVGEFSTTEAKMDPDLGRSLRHGYRNVTLPGDEERTFGVPTIRRDRVKPDRRSLADPWNYGNEPNALTLLFPAGLPCSEEYLSRPQKPQELKDLISAASIDVSDEIVERALDMGQDSNGLITLGTFMRAKEFLETGRR